MPLDSRRGRPNVAIRLLRALKRHHSRLARGQALVEFAIILPVMLLLLLIVIDFGRLFASYVQVSNASREGAAYAQGKPTDSVGIKAHAVSEMNSQGQAGQGTLDVTETCANSAGTTIDCALAAGGAGSGNTITVSATEQFTFLTPLISSFFGGGVALNASTAASVLSLASGGGNTPGNCTTPPIAAFTISVTGRTVTLDASTSSPTTGICAIAGYNWDMGDGANPFPPIVNRNVTYTYTADSTYTITLMVTNPAGNNEAFKEVTIGSASPSATPSASPSATPSPTPTASPTAAPPVCSTAPAFTSAFTGNGKGSKAHEMTFYGAYTGKPDPASWTWDFGDGSSTGSGQTSSHEYASSGTYTVKLTVQNGGCIASVTMSVVVP